MDRDVCQIAVELKKEDLAFAYEAMGTTMTDSDWTRFKGKIFGPIYISPVEHTILSEAVAKVFRDVLSAILIGHEDVLGREEIEKK